MSILYIAPAFSDQAGQCRIYAHSDDTIRNVRDHYRKYPEQWHEVGLMDSRGSIRCIEPEFAALKHDEPLMAGSIYPM